jgi:hypothetical protein
MKKFTDKINESIEDKIPTAEEFLKRDESGVYNEIDITHAMIEFTKLHVEAALKEASEKVELSDLLHEFIEDSWEGGPFIDKDTILNAYPLDNIK